MAKAAKRKPHGQTRALKNFAPKPKPEPKRDDLARARSQAAAQFLSIVEMVKPLKRHDPDRVEELTDTRTAIPNEHDRAIWDRSDDGMELKVVQAWNDDEEDEARQTIQEDALSVQVRSGWHTPGSTDIDSKPAEFEILLCTGGPAVRIIGDIGDHGEPENPQIEFQDWFTPWTRWHGEGVPAYTGSQIEETLLAYCRCFYFGDG